MAPCRFGSVNVKPACSRARPASSLVSPLSGFSNRYTGIRADRFRMHDESLLRACRQADALDESPACFRAVELPRHPFLGRAVNRSERVVVAVKHQASRAPPDAEHLLHQIVVVVVPADVDAGDDHGPEAAVVGKAVHTLVVS